MRTRPLGQSGIEASVVGLGTWAIGGWMWGGTDESKAVEAIHAAIDAGVTLIDTAPMYGFGVSESIVGRAIRDRRDRVVLATKCGLVCNSTEGTFHFNSSSLGVDPNGTAAIYKNLRPESIRRELEGSLKRLQTDCVDLYQTHWQDPSTPIEDTMGVLLELKQEGKICAIGVSNATSEEMEAYRRVGPLDADQEKFSMLDPAIRQDQLPYCREHNVAMLAYSPLGQGLLTGKLSPERTFGEGDLRRSRARYSVENRKRIGEMLAKFQPVADAHGITLAQLAIAWTVQQPGLTHALCGARNAQQAQENAAAGEVQLGAEELRTIDEAIAAHAWAPK